MSVFTVGIWTVRPGQEDEFVEAWKELAERTRADFPGATAVLLRDRDTANRFISVGPWESEDQIERWRASTTFTEGVAKARTTLEGFEPHTLDVAVAVGELMTRAAGGSVTD